jgi:hypothetical protein
MFARLSTSLMRSSRSGCSSVVRRQLHATSLLQHSTTSPPVEPVSYGKDFFLVRPEGDMPLDSANKHSLDASITFDEPSHTYFVEGEKMKSSVTEVVGNYFEKFEADLAISRMMNGPSWPRPQYQHKNDGRPFTPEEIKRQWDNIGEYARNRGTWMHYNIERHFNGLTPSDDLIEFKQFLDFEKDVVTKRGVLPHRTEWRIAAPEYSLAGSVDFVGSLPDGTYCLIDWKRSKNLANSMSNTYGKLGKYPLDHLDDCEASKYFLQLNIYRHILQKHYNIVVSSMTLASFHPNASAYFATEVPFWDEEVEKVLQDLEADIGTGTAAPKPLDFSDL